MMNQLRLIARLTTLRTTVRRRLLLYGVCAVISGGIVAFLTIVALDWMLWFPPLLRVIVAGLYVVGFVISTLYWIVRPMQARLGIDEIAARVEAYLGTLQDRLSSAVNFLERRNEESSQAGSKSMMEQVIANTEGIIADLPLESALSVRPVAARGIVLAVSVLFFAGVLVATPSWAQTGFFRYVYPWGEIEWPRTVSILPLTGDQLVPLGESATVRMRVQRGLSPSLRGVVHLRETDGQIISLAMQREESEVMGQRGATYSAVIDAVANDLTYWFEAGDATTRSRPFLLSVVRRPQVMDAWVAVEPPPYAAHIAKRVHDLKDGPVSVPVGGFVTVSVRSSAPLPLVSTNNRSGLRTETGALLLLSVNPADPAELETRWQVEEDVRFRVELKDAAGFENRGAAEYSLLATADTAPTVTVLEPQALEELTPNGSVRSVIRVEDDFGIESLELEITRASGSEWYSLSLSENLSLVGVSRTDRESGSHVEAVSRRTWRLDEIGAGPLTPGDVLLYNAVARDNHVLDEGEGEGQIGRSSTMRIRIISELEFDVRLRSDLAMLQARIRQAALDQADMLDETLRLRTSTGKNAALAMAQRETAAALAGQQARLLNRLRDLAERFDRLSERMERNHAGDEQSRGRIAALGRALREVAADSMTHATSALSRVRDADDPSDQQFAVREAAELQERAVEHLHAVLRALSQWGSFQELLTKTRDLLDRQRNVRQETLDAGRAMIGKPIDMLTDQEAAVLKRVQRKQQQLLADMEQLLASMEQQAEPSRTKDPAGADAIDAALRAARAHEATRHMQDSVGDLEGNRTAAASIAQHAAESAVRSMVDALRERVTRQLEELRKHLAQAEHQLGELIEEQRALRAATYEAGALADDSSAYRTLGEAQHRLKRNAEQLANELDDVDNTRSGSPGTGSAARLIRQSVEPMNRAEAKLNEEDATSATLAQDEAIGLLLDAFDRLEELAREAEEEVLRRSLAQIREDLEATVAAQIEVNNGIATLKKSLEERGRISRREARAASQLARQQADVRMMIEAQGADFDKVVVYRWALDRVAQWMDDSRQRLSQRAIDEQLVTLTGRIVHDLRRLLQAIADTESLPLDTSFVESDTGGGRGQGGSPQSRPVPTVAELLVLKAMQTDINERTNALHERLNQADLSEKQLREMQTIGEDQAEVQRLTEMVTRRVSHP